MNASGQQEVIPDAHPCGPDGSFAAVHKELATVFARLDALIGQACAAMSVVEQGTSSDPYRGLYVSQADASALLGRPAGVPVPGSPTRVLPQAGSRLAALRTGFELSAFDLDLLLVALAPHLDLKYERLYAFLQDDVTRRKPSIDLALNLLCGTGAEKLSRRSHFDAEAPLLASGLLRLTPDPSHLHPPLLAHYLEADAQVVRYLFHQQGLDGRLSSFCHVSEAGKHDDRSGFDGSIVAAAQALMVEATTARLPLRLHFHGPEGIGKYEAACELAARLGANLLVAEIGHAIEAGIDFASSLPVLFREAWFRHSILYLGAVDEFAEPNRAPLQRLLNRELDRYPGIVILAGRLPPSRFHDAGSKSIAVSFSEPDFTRRCEVWRTHLEQDAARFDETDIGALSSRLKLTPGGIAQIVRASRQQARWRAAGEGGAASTLGLDDLLRATREQSGHELAALAHKVEARHSWDDFMLPTPQLSQLQEICSQVRHRQQVFGAWGFAGKLIRGKGLSALFSGPPGTGKTMAAGIIAGELGLDLYRIDLSQIVNKYIGETEKNLDRVFNAAESANAILLFDEADALFGKRSEVKDAHDRYANLEVGYLLQKMEEYEGLAILATNMRQNLDDAFIRRLAVIVEFPFPDEAHRQQIWQALMPADAPLADDIDFARLASEIRLSGGHLRNIALAGAFLAAAENTKISQRHLLQAAKREFEKLGRSWG